MSNRLIKCQNPDLEYDLNKNNKKSLYTKFTNYTHVLLGLSSLTTGDVFSFQSSMTSTDKQQIMHKEVM